MRYLEIVLEIVGGVTNLETDGEVEKQIKRQDETKKYKAIYFKWKDRDL